jgi:hypothetical protein
LMGDVPWLTLAESWSDVRPEGGDEAAVEAAAMVRDRAGVEAGVAIEARVEGNDTIVTIALVAPGIEHVERRTAFLGGAMGRVRAALASAAAIQERLREAAPD